MLQNSGDSSSGSDDDNGFQIRKSPRRTGVRSICSPQHAKPDKSSSLTRNGDQSPRKFKSFSLDEDVPPPPAKDGQFLRAREGNESGTSRGSSRPHSRSLSPAAPDVGDFVVVSKGMNMITKMQYLYA